MNPVILDNAQKNFDVLFLLREFLLCGNNIDSTRMLRKLMFFCWLEITMWHIDSPGKFKYLPVVEDEDVVVVLDI
ncbi:hypothetical protein Tco_1523871 [Tanacetum coccineum]